jgi:hypothetical protein
MSQAATTEPKVYGLLAEFETPAGVYHACEGVRDAGFTQWDSLTPFPVHGLDKAMGLKRSPLPWIVLVLGLTGAAGAMFLQWWVGTQAYAMVISGKPLFAWQASIPITFELGVLFGALGSVFGLLHLCRLPQHHHPLFSSTRFERVTDDRFFIAIEANDPKYDAAGTRELLVKLGATAVEVVEDRDA